VSNVLKRGRAGGTGSYRGLHARIGPMLRSAAALMSGRRNSTTRLSRRYFAAIRRTVAPKLNNAANCIKRATNKNPLLRSFPCLSVSIVVTFMSAVLSSAVCLLSVARSRSILRKSLSLATMYLKL
jgi:hypothetical protein